MQSERNLSATWRPSPPLSPAKSAINRVCFRIPETPIKLKSKEKDSKPETKSGRCRHRCRAGGN